MKRQKGWITTLFASGVFLIGAAIILLLSNTTENFQQSDPSIRVPVTANYPAPELYLTDLQDKSVSLNDYLGFVVLINNWATWCPPCKAEMPELLAYYEAHIEDGFILVAIESGDSRAEVSAFAEAYMLTFPIWLDPYGDALIAFQNWDLPSSYVIDRDGTVRYSWIGPVTLQTLEKYVTPLLER